MPWLMSQARSSRRKARRVFVLGESRLECAIWMAICQSAATWSRQERSSSSSKGMPAEDLSIQSCMSAVALMWMFAKDD